MDGLLNLSVSYDFDKRRSLLDQTFRISITLKGIDGVLEIIDGLIVLFGPVPGRSITWLRRSLNTNCPKILATLSLCIALCSHGDSLTSRSSK